MAKKILMPEDFNTTDEYLEYSWLNIGDIRQIVVHNRMMDPEWSDGGRIPELIVNTCRDPDYMHFFAKYVLNINLLPIQTATLSVLWNTPFPILIGSRGSSKSFMLAIYAIMRAVLHQGSTIAIVGAALRQSLVLFNYITNIYDNAPILRDICGGKNGVPKKDLSMAYWKVGNSKVIFLPLGTGEKIRGQRACVDGETLIETSHGLIKIKDSAKFMADSDFGIFNSMDTTESPAWFIQTKPIPTYKITMMGNYELICSDIHRIMTSNGWKYPKDLTTDDLVEFAYSQHFTNKYIQYEDLVLDEKMAFLFGILISEGAISSKHHIDVKMTDKNCIDLIHQLFIKLFPDVNVGRYEYESRFDQRWNVWHKPTFDVKICDIKLRKKLAHLGLDYKKSRQKEIPSTILRSPKSVVTSFLCGLFWGDGSAFLYKDRKRDNNFGIAYYTDSKKLADQLQVLITKYDLFVTKLSRHEQYGLRIYGASAIKFAEIINVPKHKEVLDKCYRGNLPPRKYSHLRVRSVERLDDRCLYDYNLPESQKFIGNCIINHNTCVICDEFASISDDIFQVVVRGFASTRSDGVFENVVKQAKRKVLSDQGISIDENLENSLGVKNILGGNQIIMAGTPTFSFNHFYRYYKQYKTFIESGGDADYIRSVLGEDIQIPSNFNPKDYAIIRIPAEALPEGMMDHKVLEQAKMTMDKALYGNEYGAIFTEDSEGFYLASYLNAATCPIKKQDREIRFGPKLWNDMQIPCIMGVDPASENDNFAISIIELFSDYRGLIYVWSTNRKDFEKMKREGLIPNDINDYHTFCIHHIRDLCRRFNIQMIVCDAQGGGAYVREGLKDQDKMKPGDHAIYDMDDENIPLNVSGKRILKMIEFSNAKWRNESHYGLRQDINDKILLFPEHDAVEVELSSRVNSGSYETLEDCYLEVLECKTETTMVKHTQTTNGTEQWTVPKIKGMDSEEINKRLKKDRFTSLLLSNWGARIYNNEGYNHLNYQNSIGYAVKKNSSHSLGQKVPNVRVTKTRNGRKIFR